MTKEERESAAGGILLFATIGGIGFGYWMHNVGAGFFMATVLLAAIIASENLEKK